jgi:hypothetical protein
MLIIPKDIMSMIAAITSTSTSSRTAPTACMARSVSAHIEPGCIPANRLSGLRR